MSKHWMDEGYAMAGYLYPTRALSVRLPHAQRIREGVKTLEIRTWQTKHRGFLLICASKRVDWGDVLEFESVDDSARGHAVCLVNLVDCRPMRRDDEDLACVPFKEGLYAWVLEEVDQDGFRLRGPGERIVPFPVKGKQGLFCVNVQWSDSAGRRVGHDGPRAETSAATEGVGRRLPRYRARRRGQRGRG